MLVCWTQRGSLPSPWCMYACDPKSILLCRKVLLSGVCVCDTDAGSSESGAGPSVKCVQAD